MQSPTATRRFQFCAGHRVHNHESKCRNIHGHNYVLFVTAQRRQDAAGRLDQIGRVLDFSEIKERVGNWIDQCWDHGFIYWEQDMEIARLFNIGATPHHAGPLMTHKGYAMPTNPTAENMAEHLLLDICPVMFRNTDVIITEVTLWETENCYATSKL